jgi:hypothetical protein
MIAIAMVALCIFHPGRCFSHRRDGKANYFSNNTSESLENGADGYAMSEQRQNDR